MRAGSICGAPRAPRGCPIIVLTARHSDQAAADGLAAGADDYITKPFSAAELVARVRAARELAVLRQTAVDQAQPAPSRSAPRWTVIGSPAAPSGS